MTSTASYEIRLEDVLDLGDYERRRDEIRREAMKARNLRRVQLGPNATIAFENRETVLYQIQEMCRAERLAKPEHVQHEIETYNELLPSGSELSATLLLEYPDKAERDERLTELLGLEEHLGFVVAGETSGAVFDKRQIDVDRLSSVQFVKFPLSDSQREALIGGSTAKIVSDHPKFTYEMTLSDDVARALASDLQQASLQEN